MDDPRTNAEIAEKSESRSIKYERYGRSFGTNWIECTRRESI